MHVFFSSFFPIFISMDSIGLLPFFIFFTSKMSPAKRIHMTYQIILVAGAIGLLFIPFGSLVLQLLGLKNGDFQIAGGILLLVISLKTIVGEEKHLVSKTSLGIVPIGIPMLVGPAVFATLILLKNNFSLLDITVSLSLNLIIALVIFMQSNTIIQYLGITGTQVLSKLSALLLSAYAIMMIRVGLSSLKMLF